MENLDEKYELALQLQEKRLKRAKEINSINQRLDFKEISIIPNGYQTGTGYLRLVDDMPKETMLEKFSRILKTLK